MRNLVLSFIKEHKLIEKGNRVLVACSGGSDSMALLHFLNEEKETLQIEVSAVHVNHMLRGEESEEDRRFVERFCSERLIPFYDKSIPIPEILKEENGNLQAVCRRERYDYFEEVMKAEDFQLLATAHHADDQLESVLMEIVRGTALNRAPGMRVSRRFGRGKLIRPFMGIGKMDILHYIEQNDLSFREDSSNQKDDYMRNRFRHHILPLVKEENPNASLAAVKWAERQAEDENFMNRIAKVEFERITKPDGEGRITVDSRQFVEIPSALQRRIVLLLLNYLYDQTQIGDLLVEAVLKQCQLGQGNAELSLPDGGRLFRYYETVVLERDTEKTESLEPVLFPINTWIKADNGILLKWAQIDEADNDGPSAKKWYFNLHPDELPLMIRNRREGDRIKLPNMPSAKKVSRVFIDTKVPADKRDRLLLIVSNKGEVLAIPTIRYGNRFSSVCKGNESYILFVADQFEQES